MKIYLYNPNGFFLSESEALESPLQKGVFLVPANATTKAPPSFSSDQLPQFDGQDWIVAENPTVTLIKQVQAEDQRRKDAGKKFLDDQAKAMTYRDRRAAEYPTIGDQLDALFKARQGDTTDLVAIDAKIAAIKAKYPKPIGQI